MNPMLMIYPCMALFGLISIVMLVSFSKRKEALRKKEMEFKYFKTYHDSSNVPVQILALGRNYANLFEMPTYFLFLCIVIACLNKTCLLYTSPSPRD